MVALLTGSLGEMKLSHLGQDHRIDEAVHKQRWETMGSLCPKYASWLDLMRWLNGQHSLKSQVAEGGGWSGSLGLADANY